MGAPPMRLATSRVMASARYPQRRTTNANAPTTRNAVAALKKGWLAEVRFNAAKIRANAAAATHWLRSSYPQQKNQEEEKQRLANGVGPDGKARSQRAASSRQHFGVVQVGSPAAQMALPKVDQGADQQHARTCCAPIRTSRPTTGSRTRPISTLDHEISVWGQRRRTYGSSAIYTVHITTP
jgi:hypothetical protein